MRGNLANARSSRKCGSLVSATTQTSSAPVGVINSCTRSPQYTSTISLHGATAKCLRKPNRSRLASLVGSSPAAFRTADRCPSAPISQRHRWNSPSILKPSRWISETRAPHRRDTPAAAALSTNIRCSSSRRRPIPWPLAKRASADDFSSENRMPLNGMPRWGSRVMPSSASAETAAGSRPSPHVLSIGGPAQSTTVALRPLRRAAIPVASPAGPPPRITTSTGFTRPLEPRFPHQRSSTNSEQNPGPIAARMLSVPGAGRRLR